MLQSHKPKILIVDDVTDNIKILIDLLAKEYKTFFADSGSKALEIAEAKSPKSSSGSSSSVVRGAPKSPKSWSCTALVELFSTALVVVVVAVFFHGTEIGLVLLFFPFINLSSLLLFMFVWMGCQ